MHQAYLKPHGCRTMRTDHDNPQALRYNCYGNTSRFHGPFTCSKDSIILVRAPRPLPSRLFILKPYFLYPSCLCRMPLQYHPCDANGFGKVDFNRL